jgi:hypothetical protein
MLFVVAERTSDQGARHRLPRRGPLLSEVERHRSIDGKTTLLVLGAHSRGEAEEALKVLAEAYDRVWIATRHGKGAVTSHVSDGVVLVERSFETPVQLEDIRDKERLGAWCLNLHGVEFLHTYLSEDQLRMVCAYQARDAEAVRIAQRTIGLPVDRVWTTSSTRESTSEAAGERLVLFDTTLRDGLTGRRIPKSRLSDLCVSLDESGLDVIEVGLVDGSGTTSGTIPEECTGLHSATACCLAYPQLSAIEMAADVLSKVERRRLHVFNQVSDRRSQETRITDLGPGRLAEIAETVSIARRHCDDVQWSAFDATRAAPEFLYRAFSTAIASGATTVCLADSYGHALPDEFSELVRQLLQHVPRIDEVVLSVHCHDDLDLATANSLAALAVGARQIEGTIGGIGPRGGNTSIESIIRAVAAYPTRYPLSIRADVSKLEAIATTIHADGESSLPKQ